MYERGLRDGNSSSGGCGSRGRRRLFGFADFRVALGKLEPDGLWQVGIETDTLLQLNWVFQYVKAAQFIKFFVKHWKGKVKEV